MRRIAWLCVGLGVLWLGERAPGQCEFSELHSVVADDSASGALLGSSAALQGDLAVLGARRDGGSGQERGAAYLYHFDGTAWLQGQKLQASDGADLDEYGNAVAAGDGSVLVASHQDDDQGTNSGTVYVYRQDPSSWTLEQKLLAADGHGFALFGASVALQGDVAVVGAPQHGPPGGNGGAVYVFRRFGVEWIQEQKITAADASAGDEFGISVSIDGDRIAVGARKNDDAGINSGAVYVFRAQGFHWVQEQKVLANDGAALDQFGSSISLSGSALLVGAPLKDENGANSGTAYVFRREGETWVQEKKLRASDGSAADQLGSSVVLQGGLALVGAPEHDAAGINAGAAYVFRFNGVTWVEVQRMESSDAAAADALGLSLALSGDQVVLGAPGSDTAEVEAGSASFYQLPDTLQLEVSEEQVDLEDEISFVTCGGEAGQIALLVLTEVDGSSVFLPLPVSGRFDLSRTWAFTGTLQASPGDINVDFATLTLDASGAVVQSNAVTLDFP